MTDRHDTSWGPDDDQEIRDALMALMDDVTAEPLPEPSFIRARAEGGADASGGKVVDLASRRRRSFAVIAGVAAAALVATGASLLVWDRDDSVPAATSASSSDLRPLTMLGAAEWSTALDVDVTSTRDSTETDRCFRIANADTTTWTRKAASLSDGRVVGGQWIGTAESGSRAPTEASDQAVERCKGRYTTTQKVTEDLPGGATYRAWHAKDTKGAGVWWVEATRGPSTSFLSVAEVDGHTYTSDGMRQLALGALGDVDLASAARPDSSVTTSSTSTTAPTTPTTTPAPTTTATATATATDSSATTTSSGGSSAPSIPSDSPTPPSMSPTTIGTITGAYFVPVSSWSSETLNGSRQVATSPTSPGTPIDGCTTQIRSEHTRGWGLTTVGSDGQPFGYQHVFLEANAKDSDARLRQLTSAYERSTCAATNGGPTTVTKVGSDVYRLETGGAARFVTVVRMRSHAVSVLVLDGNALQGKDDGDLVSELLRLKGIAALR